MHTFRSYVKQKYGSTTWIAKKGNNIELSFLHVPREVRKQGTGTKILNDLHKVADGLGKTVGLDPASKNPQLGTTSRSRLVKFYKKNGYVENKGKNTDYDVKNKMYRRPLDEEGVGYVPTVDFGCIDVDDKSTRVRINSALADALISSCITPYVGLERVRKALAPFHIHIPGVNFLEGEEGEHVFEVNQFGPKVGQGESGQFLTKDDSNYEIVFRWYQIGYGCSCSAKIRKTGEETK